MKTIFTVLALSFVSSGALAQTIYFGFKESSRTHNEYCSYTNVSPRLTDGPDATPIQRQLVASLNARWEARDAELLLDYEKALVSSSDACKELFNSYQVTESFRITTDLGSPIISIVTTSSGYYGGAHGSAAQSGFTFNQVNGDIYQSLSSFLEYDQTKPLLALLETRLMEQRPETDLDFGWNDWKKGITDLNRITNFFFNNQGIVVYFNPYEIGSYAEGFFEIQLSWWDLSRLKVRAEVKGLLSSRYGDE